MINRSSALRASIVASILFVSALIILLSGGLERIERDVSSFLPQSDSAEARLARSLINEQQAKTAYLLLESENFLSGEALEDAFNASEAIASFVRLDDDLPLGPLRLNESDRLALLFPKRFANLRAAFESTVDAENSFAEWAAHYSVRQLDAALQSPEFIELSQSELFDPLLLAIDALQQLPESDEEIDELDEEQSSARYWLRLSGSGMDPAFQERYAAELQRFQKLVVEIDPEARLRSGGLIELATGSRERIQSDVFRINLISTIGVAIAAFVLLRRLVPLLAAVPTLLSAALGALAVSALVFDRLNIIVLVIGSVLIGTSIDYALHMLLGSKRGSAINSRKLLFFACLSTVAGFCALLFSSMELVQQIGVFVASGLACAYATAACFRPLAKQPSPFAPSLSPNARRIGSALLIIALGFAAWGLVGLRWEEDLSKLEAADPERVQADSELRQRFGDASGQTLIVSTGANFLASLQEQSELLRSVDLEDAEALALSSILPTLKEVQQAAEAREEIDAFFTAFQAALDRSGYESAAFASFFQAARLLPDAESFIADVESRIQGLAESLTGPSAFLLQGQAGFASTALSVNRPPEVFAAALQERPDSVLLSNLAFLNRHLESTREELVKWGSLAMAAVGITIIVAFGPSLGVAVLAFPALAFAAALGLTHLIQGPLSLFHLIGGYLGAALALDYALFSVVHFRHGNAIPTSVWLSFATTGAAFAALLYSAIAVVQAIGLTVLLLTGFTILSLYLAQPHLRKSPSHVSPP